MDLPVSTFDTSQKKKLPRDGKIGFAFVATATFLMAMNALLLLRSDADTFSVFSAGIFTAGNTFEIANRQSGGFFTDIDETNWNLLRDRVEKRKNHCCPAVKQNGKRPNAWYQDNWEPDFTCMQERRVGRMGDGAKWVCDPHRIAEKKDKCLVYSVGSNGDFNFEETILKEVHQDCEIHTFDPSPRYASKAPKNVHYHSWGLGSATDQRANFKSLNETVNELGHQGRVIDIFKIDCEGCEWTTFSEWFYPHVAENTILKQILVEVHNHPDEADSFFRSLQRFGYVTFHKEPNIKFGGGKCVEYALLKLENSFFEGMNFTIDEYY